MSLELNPNEYTRAMIDRVAANEIGAAGCCLLSVLASTLHPESPFWTPIQMRDAALLPMAGISSPKRLDKVRQAAIDAGWLSCEPGANGEWIYVLMIPGVMGENRE